MNLKQALIDNDSIRLGLEAKQLERSSQGSSRSLN